jgi:predicted kinase
VFVVVSGLPASGKTTLGRPLSARLGLPLLDKDDVLESLLEGLGAASPDERRRLSRASDAVVERVARVSPAAVLCSFWRRESLSTMSGTPTSWLRELPDVVEVFCDCSPRVAAERFHSRVRPEGHFDADKSFEDSLCRFEQLAAAGPLAIGPLVRVDTTRNVDVAAVAEAVRHAIGKQG